MRVVNAQAHNFGSYEYLDFGFANKGLTVIQGATGSGKSTLCDLVPWIIFGKTAKNGAVDEVLQWPGNKPLNSIIELQTQGRLLSIIRTRNPNDLSYIVDDNAIIIRGKDLSDTQKQINQLLGMDIDLYLASSYYHEFSETAQFFTANAKTRRALCEQIVDLSMPIKLKDKLVKNRKETNISLEEANRLLASNEARLDLFYRIQKTELTKSDEWVNRQDTKRHELLNKLEKFELNREIHIQDLSMKYMRDIQSLRISTTCPTCGAPKSQDHKAESHYGEQIQNSKDRVNPYLDQLETLDKEENPHTGSFKDYSSEIGKKENDIKVLKQTIHDFNVSIDDLTLLEQALSDMRTLLIQNAIGYIEDNTNKLLSEYFDAELVVSFSADEFDKLEVKIQKNGNNCVYTQLSKGQRQILKLCFSLAVMQATSNHNSISTNAIFLDEAMDGLDDNFKVKAFRLLENLALQYESVFVVEHSETIKVMFNNKIEVSLINGNSVINE